MLADRQADFKGKVELEKWTGSLLALVYEWKKEERIDEKRLKCPK